MKRSIKLRQKGLDADASLTLVMWQLAILMVGVATLIIKAFA